MVYKERLCGLLIKRVRRQVGYQIVPKLLIFGILLIANLFYFLPPRLLGFGKLFSREDRPISICIIGASGYIGSTLYDAFSSQAYRVIGVRSKFKVVLRAQYKQQ